MEVDSDKNPPRQLGKKRPLEENPETKRLWSAQWNDPQTATVQLVEQRASVSIAGRGAVCCRQGNVRGHGFSLQKDEWYPFECPKWSSWLVLEAESDTAVIHIKSRSVGEKGVPPDGKDATMSHGPMPPPHMAQNEDTASFSLYDTDNPNSRPTHVLPEWKDAVERILIDPSHGGEDTDPMEPRPSIIAVVGAKGVGKSTFVRYLVHRFLSQTPPKPVHVLDGDTGQAEFGPPGLLTLTHLPQAWPLWSLPHHHMLVGGVSDPKNPLAPPGATQTAVFFGGITSEVDPGRYLESLTHLVQQYRDTVSAEKRKEPLIVNLDGWVKGLGFQVLSTFLNTHKPAHVVQINGANATQQVDVSEVLPGSVACVHTLPYFRSASSRNVAPALSVPSSAWRDLRYVHYWLDDPGFEVHFSQNDLIEDSEGDIAYRLASQQPYVVPWDCIQYQTIDEKQFSPEALNGCIVGLCENWSREGSKQCVGLGIVRSVDRKKRFFYVLTPVLPAALSKVSHFILGNLCLPVACLRLGKRATSFPFHWEANMLTDIVGTAPMRSRKNILRKGVNA